MDWIKLGLGFVAVLVVTAGGNFLIHGMLLQRDYSRYPNLLRAKDDNQGASLMLSFAVFSAAVVALYAALDHGSHWGHGLGLGIHFALGVWLIASVSRYLTYYAIQPWSKAVVGKQIGYELVMMLVMGVALALIF